MALIRFAIWTSRAALDIWSKGDQGLKRMKPRTKVYLRLLSALTPRWIVPVAQWAEFEHEVFDQTVVEARARQGQPSAESQLSTWSEELLHKLQQLTELSSLLESHPLRPSTKYELPSQRHSNNPEILTAEIQ